MIAYVDRFVRYFFGTAHLNALNLASSDRPQYARSSGFSRRRRSAAKARLPLSLVLGVQLIGNVKRLLEVKIGAFTAFVDRKPVPLIVPNRVVAGVSSPSHYVPKWHGVPSHHATPYSAIDRSL